MAIRGFGPDSLGRQGPPCPTRRGNRYTFDDPVETGYAGALFPAITTLEVTELIDDDGCVSVSMTSEIDSEQYLPVLLENLSAIETLSQKQIAELTWFYEDFVNVQTVTAQYDYGTGHFRRISEHQLRVQGGEEFVRTTTLTDVTHLTQPGSADAG